ncbi:MAG: hypothetical protein GXO02_05780, partial [Epsilonproteobacteria bacterium]|nr:hypothetical protein [Campylobacterota bacterium]
SNETSLSKREFLISFLKELKKDDEIIIASLDILSSKIKEAMIILNCFLSRNITLHIASNAISINQKTELETIMPLIVKLENEKKSIRSKRVGRPKGSSSLSKFDPLFLEILEGLKAKKSVTSLAKELKVSRSSLKDYIKSRGIKELLDKRVKKIKNQEKLKCTINFERKEDVDSSKEE